MNSKTFCIAPWVHICVRPTGRLTPCCEWKEQSDSALAKSNRFEMFDQWKNSDQMKQTRQQLHSGQKIDSCSTCWVNEASGKKSLRQVYNNEFSRYFDFSTMDTQTWEVDNSITTIDLKLGNLCNLKCAMCSPRSSSQLMSEYLTNKDKFHSLENYQPTPTDLDFTWPLTSDFKDFMDQFRNQIRWIKFTGGEPTIIPYVLDVLKEIKRPELVTVSFTTNGTRVNTELLDVLSKFKTVWISASLEGIGDHNDTIRYLSNWQEVEKNIIELAKLPNLYFNINHVLQCFSASTLIPLLHWCEQKQFTISLNPLSHPVYLSINSVEPGVIDKFTQELGELTLQVNYKSVSQVIAFLKTYQYDENLHKQRIQYLTKLDQIRNTELLEIV
jgi:radical SAM protein with 4Fe4S-binding SPASM domain